MSCTDLRQVYCGYQQQQDEIFEAAKRFMEDPTPGMFIIGGTNLTGKSTLKKRIERDSGYYEFYVSESTNAINPKKTYADQVLGFVDFRGIPQKITRDNLYAAADDGSKGYILRAIEKRVQVFFFDESWVGQTDSLQMIYTELVEHHQSRVLLDVVSSRQGKGFFDGNANNKYIYETVHQHIPNAELHTLDFSISGLYNGVVEIAKESGDFNTAIRMFQEDQRVRLVDAQIHGHVERELSSIIGWQPNSWIETSRFSA